MFKQDNINLQGVIKNAVRRAVTQSYIVKDNKQNPYDYGHCDYS